MAISSVSINPPASSSVSSIVSNAAAPFVDGGKSSADKQASAVVTLSAQGQKLSQTEPQTSQTQSSPSQTSNQADTAAAENTETTAKETAEPPGIQLFEGERQSGRVSTYA